MARVMISCPKTGKPVYTGFSCDETAFRETNSLTNRFRAPNAARCISGPL